MEQTIEITQAKKKELEERREYLINVERPKADVALNAARSLGDLSENADFDAARETFEKIRNEIDTISFTLDHAKIIDESKIDKNVVSATGEITLKRVDNGKTYVVKIIGTSNTKPLNGEINSECPVAKAILGHKVGDVVEVEAKVVYSVEIVKIEYKN